MRGGARAKVRPGGWEQPGEEGAGAGRGQPSLQAEPESDRLARSPGPGQPWAAPCTGTRLQGLGPGRPPCLGWRSPPLLGFAGTPHVRGRRCLGKWGSPRCPGCPGWSRTALPAAADGAFGPAPSGSPQPAGLSGCQLCCGAILRPEPARRRRMPVLQLLAGHLGHRAPPPLPPRPSLASPPPSGPSAYLSGRKLRPGPGRPGLQGSLAGHLCGHVALVAAPRGWGRAAIWRPYQAWGGAATASSPG